MLKAGRNNLSLREPGIHTQLCVFRTGDALYDYSIYNPANT